MYCFSQTEEIWEAGTFYFRKLKQQIETMATSVTDSEILSKLETYAYHKSCYTAYQTREKRLLKQHEESSYKCRLLHKQASSPLMNFITDKIIENNPVMYLSQLFSRYQTLVLEFGVNIIEPTDRRISKRHV